jgi:hypothetical protein
MFPNGLPIINNNQSPPYTHQPIYMYPMRIKLDLPKFDGDEKKGDGWINKA